MQAGVEAHRDWLWGLAYRMTGVAADADEIVQDTFLRAVERPPDGSRPLRPWLTTVTLNLARDRLRRRRRARYVGPWLPAPVPDEALEPPSDTPGADAQLMTRESASFAFLLSLEVLTSNQRAVLLLREVLGLDVAETAALLGMREGNVKVTHHRARAALAAGAADPRQGRAGEPADLALLAALLGAIGRGDAAAAAALLAPDAVAMNDGGGVYLAARVPIRGAAKIAAFFTHVSRGAEGVRVGLGAYNGGPAVVLGLHSADPRRAPLTVVRAEAKDGLITRLYWVLAPGKLTAVPAPS